MPKVNGEMITSVQLIDTEIHLSENLTSKYCITDMQVMHCITVLHSVTGKSNTMYVCTFNNDLLPTMLPCWPPQHVMLSFLC